MSPQSTNQHREIPLSRGMVALVDSDDYDRLAMFKWYAMKGRKTWYAVRRPGTRKNKLTFYMHRVIRNAPDGLEVDHWNRNGLDNMKENLRVVTHAENEQNRGANKNNTSGIKGVNYCKQTGRWGAKFEVFGKRYWLGRFKTKEEAGQAIKDRYEKVIADDANNAMR